MKKILLPIDGSDRSRKSVDFVKGFYSPQGVDLTVVTVREDMEFIRSEEELQDARNEVTPLLAAIADKLSGYSVKTQVLFGKAGEEILNYAEHNGTDIIIMTKSTRTGWSRIIGSVTSHVVKYANCIVVIVPEN